MWALQVFKESNYLDNTNYHGNASILSTLSTGRWKPWVSTFEPSNFGKIKGHIKTAKILPTPSFLKAFLRVEYQFIYFLLKSGWFLK